MLEHSPPTASGISLALTPTEKAPKTAGTLLETLLRDGVDPVINEALGGSHTKREPLSHPLTRSIEDSRGEARKRLPESEIRYCRILSP